MGGGGGAPSAGNGPHTPAGSPLVHIHSLRTAHRARGGGGVWARRHLLAREDLQVFGGVVGLLLENVLAVHQRPELQRLRGGTGRVGGARIWCLRALTSAVGVGVRVIPVRFPRG